MFIAQDDFAVMVFLVAWDVGKRFSMSATVIHDIRIGHGVESLKYGGPDARKLPHSSLNYMEFDTLPIAAAST